MCHVQFPVFSHYRSVFFIFVSLMSCIQRLCRVTFDSGIKILTSKNAFCPLTQKLRADTSTLASSLVLAVFKPIFLQLLDLILAQFVHHNILRVINSAVKSRISLCLIDMNPPQSMFCSEIAATNAF